MPIPTTSVPTARTVRHRLKPAPTMPEMTKLEIGAPAPAPTPPNVQIAVTCDPRINFAFQQNAIPVVREVRLINTSPTALQDLRINISTEPGFALPLVLRVQAIAAGGEFRASPVELTLNPTFLYGLTERMNGLLRIEVLAGGEPVGRHTQEIALLARHEWCGLASLPEILAAFVLPNDPAVMQILGRAAALLQRTTGRAALNGYQDRSRQRAWEQVAAIHGAIASYGLRYINPPASFEETGQKVRFPGEIIEHRFATCLDLALLFAACCEQAGLHPVLLLHAGHSYAGCWLDERTLPEAASDDLQLIRKLVDTEELTVFEPLTVTHETPGTLDHAELLARPHLNPDAAFRLALDVRRARFARILPLPVTTAAQFPAAVPPSVQLPAETTGLGHRKFVELPSIDAVVPAPREATRIDQWKSRLLDLSLRNRLLNFSPTLGTVQIFCPDPDRVEDELSEDVELALLPRAKIMAAGDPREATTHARHQGEDPVTTHLRQELAQGRLHTNLDPAEHQRCLTGIFRAARLSVEENGANTLFAAVGFLEWRETEHSDRLLRAPLLLVPVQLKRKSVLEGFSLSRLDDETRLNVTLVEMLRQHFHKEIPGIDPLPEDETGVDAALVLRRFQDAVRDLPGWEVKREVWLGQFSFTKFLLWKDLADRLDDLTRNRVVRHLVQEAGTPYPNASEDITPPELDDRVPPGEVFCPRSVDSSQLAAVLAAAAGHDFVLEGPPGTGKSQTITNIIAHCLANGKRVLFVAEKRAALDVVHRRLKEEGLEPFCLELHSNRTGKADVLAQFRQALDFAGAREPADWQQRAAELLRVRDELNAYARALHQSLPCGLSPHACFDHLLTCRELPFVKLFVPPAARRQATETGVGVVDRGPASTKPATGHTEASLGASDPDRMKLDLPDILTLTADGLEQRRRSAVDLSERAAPLSPLADHPLATLHGTEWSPAWDERAREQRATLGGRAAAAEVAAQSLRAWLQRPVPVAVGTGVSASPPPQPTTASTGTEACRNDPSFAFADRRELGLLDALAGSLLAPQPVGAEFITTPWPQLAPDLERWQALVLERVEHRSKLAAFDEKLLLALDLPALHAQWQRAQESWFLPRLLGSASVQSALAAAFSGPRKPTTQEIAFALPRAVRLREVTTALAADEPVATARLGPTWNRGEPDPDALAAVQAWGEKLHAQIEALAAGDLDALRHLRSVIGGAVAEGVATLRSSAITGYCRGYREAWAAFNHALDAFAQTVALDRTGYDGEADHLGAARRLVERVTLGWREIRYWCAWQRVRAEAHALGLAPLVASMEAGRTPPAEVPAWFERSIRRGLFDAILEHDDVLRRFFGHEHESRIRRFRELDDQMTKLTREFVRARLAVRIPREKTDDTSPKSELGLLRKELGKRARHIPVRQLLGRIPTLLPQLKPCVLMSPLSVAQYLEPSHQHFDLVVFDEASQIPVWDAVGAIARGKQLVVVGDPKQLPPTNFFNRGESGDEEQDEALLECEDLESILDELLSHGLRHKHLQWHYRSRHESLIAFSNRYYYENNLLTFPSPDAKHGGVRFHFVEQAHYDKGLTRTNRGEAEALVATLVERLRDPAGARRSYGVVTFSQAQQELIENLLDEQRRKFPEIEPHFGDEPPVEGESVFVKNLENVQGDERDVILFSICYGPDEKGAISMNFGPLNRDGGERRLNVAITRAKHELLVFTTLHGDQIDLTRTRARGVRDLRHFLDYAERGSQVLAATPAGERAAAPVSEFERAVAQRLRAAGHEVHHHVGCSGYRLDLAVADPTAPGRYLLGIECDGETYHRAATARDRDKLRQMVLKSLGWRLHRLWSTDWWHDADRETERLLKAIADATPPPPSSPQYSPPVR